MPSAIAAVRTKTLNVEPGCRRACATRLNWLPVRPGVTAVIARIAPFAGLIETTADAGSFRRYMVSLIAFRAAACSLGLIVLLARRPPERSVLAVLLAIIWLPAMLKYLGSFILLS